MSSLYERIGGESAIDLFYDKVMADPRTKPFFEQLDRNAQIRKQRSFLAWALGAPDEYKRRDLRSAHAKLVKERGLGVAIVAGARDHLVLTRGVEFRAGTEPVARNLALSSLRRRSA